jgi:DNA processing protein
LIRDGAKMVLGVDDILEELGPLFTLQQGGTGRRRAARDGAAETSWLLPLVGFEMIALDELVRRSGRPVAQVLGHLSTLELAGQVTRTAGGYIRS